MKCEICQSAKEVRRMAELEYYGEYKEEGWSKRL
jgi:hypothetical protein